MPAGAPAQKRGSRNDYYFPGNYQWRSNRRFRWFIEPGPPQEFQNSPYADILQSYFMITVMLFENYVSNTRDFFNIGTVNFVLR